VLGGSLLQVLDQILHPFERAVEIGPELPGLVGDDGAIR